MELRSHSVVMDADKCIGCTNCIKQCPTEAIRVRSGKAFILTERCIDCGECIRICKNHAKKAVSADLETLKQYEYRVALPAPSLYAQFKGEKPEKIIAALSQIGFDEVYEVAFAAELTTCAIHDYIMNQRQTDSAGPYPLISSSCPAVTRLLQIRFPSLIPHLIPVDPPYITAAKCFLFSAGKTTEVKHPPGESGCFFYHTLSSEDYRPQQLWSASRRWRAPDQPPFWGDQPSSGGERTYRRSPPELRDRNRLGTGWWGEFWRWCRKRAGR